MSDEPILTAERAFFTGLMQADVEALGKLLADDFLLIDVMQGAEVPRSALLDLIGSGQLRFGAVEIVDSRVRRYGAAAVVTGQTRMRGQFGDQSFTAHSRYTHVYVEREGRWRLVTAQGTRISEANGAV
ncbi:MAG TPA: nuclear transport factor 2 family protein [Gemmatimonadales bacterium]|nr:nuclear transport factor 2 family protein [Gemmatimonadales bacterium]